MLENITFNCPGCDRVFNAEHDLAGESIKCSRCSTRLTIPVASEPPTTRMEAHGGLAEPRHRPATRLRKRRNSSTKPVEMRLPYQLGGMKVEVDQKTSNSMATAFLGGLLVALGAVIVLILGGKKSA